MLGKALSLAGYILVSFILRISATGEEDLVKLPNVTFTYDFKVYSGYLEGRDDNTYKMFYLLTESQGKAETDPLVLWLNGGPGCSSLGGSFQELGPFYVNRDGHSLFENVYAWNKNANILFLESPAGVGFSYFTTGVDGYDPSGDDATAQVNYHALNDFFTRVQPKYKNRAFFITGESYGGIYLPTLARLLVRGINGKTFANPNFQGVAIGNGWMNEPLQTNSMILWFNYHGAIGVDDWKIVKESCCSNHADVDTCDFYSQFAKNPESKYADADGDRSCARAVIQAINFNEDIDPYNFYEDCYQSNVMRMAKRFYSKIIKPAKNSATRLHYSNSTDNQNGYPCWAGDALWKYLNQPSVMKALHVSDEWIKSPRTEWFDCNDDLNAEYVRQYDDTTEIFKDIINEVQTPGFHFLVYNGDVDTVCDFLGGAWHISALAHELNMTSTVRTAWEFRNRVAGFTQRYSNKNVAIDLLTVKGAGHFVPNDRPGPSLQMLTNFLSNSGDYSSTEGFDPLPQPHPSATPNPQGSVTSTSVSTSSRATTTVAVPPKPSTAQGSTGSPGASTAQHSPTTTSASTTQHSTTTTSASTPLKVNNQFIIGLTFLSATVYKLFYKIF